jgi:hypothetical protein
MSETKRKRIWIRVLLVFFGLLVLLAVGFIAWGETPAKPMPEAFAALQPGSSVTVTDGKWLTFSPTETDPTTGFIFYPGGRVDYRAYAPAARQIAELGYLVVIVPMPLNLAVFDPNAAEAVMAAYPEIEHWVIGGHSLGGAMAANFAHNRPGTVDGLVLWASYPAESDDLSQSDLSVLSVSGTHDGLSTPEKIDASRVLLPSDTEYAPIEGGNHAQFGWYGEQNGDNPAAISRQEQQTQIVDATAAFLADVR